MSYLLRGVSPLGGAPTDLLLAKGVITAVGADASAAAGERGVTVVDGSTLVALPGLVDLHTHLREPGRELSLIHISEPTRLGMISYAVFCLKKKKKKKQQIHK